MGFNDRNKLESRSRRSLVFYFQTLGMLILGRLLFVNNRVLKSSRCFCLLLFMKSPGILADCTYDMDFGKHVVLRAASSSTKEEHTNGVAVLVFFFYEEFRL
ncbi:hypothetical protein OCU04_002110 [Sclerotinia nivalis]|uniref:Uncharacterized protein n=1 Tax=Sclerotinia nivalis TaxID=352851 RepID=A0A9X0AZH1_9HELO|nr:hypothetical protein OCU04_002110 [Sclerotinia nivalis]